MYQIHEVPGLKCADTINEFNSHISEWPLLSKHHLENGYWWLAFLTFMGGEAVGFAGMVPFTPFEKYGYLKRCYINPSHLGHGLQNRLLLARELKAKQLGWTHLIAESNSRYSNSNFAIAGYISFDPEQPWGRDGDTYWIKKLTP